MKYKNYIFDLYATLVDIHTNQNPAVFWRRIAAIMHSYGAVYKPSDLKKRYRSLIAANEARLSKELGTEYPEIELGDLRGGARHLQTHSALSPASDSNCIRIRSGCWIS